MSSVIPGMTAKHAIITPTCRQNKGHVAAFEEAITRLFDEYGLINCYPENTEVSYHLVLTVERPAQAAGSTTMRCGNRFWAAGSTELGIPDEPLEPGCELPLGHKGQHRAGASHWGPVATGSTRQAHEWMHVENGRGYCSCRFGMNISFFLSHEEWQAHVAASTRQDTEDGK
jgi:hypothetical protein